MLLRRPPFRLRINTVALAPEGWAFFTRNPREAVVLVHKMRDIGRWERLSLANFTPGNLFGLRRSSRLLTTEMALLLRGIPSDRWVPCRASIPECLAREKPATFTVEKKTPAVASLCGETVLQVVEPVPWAWSSSRDRIRMPSKILKLKVRCS